MFYEWANNPYRDMVYNDILLSHYKQASRELKIAGDGKEEIYSTFIGGSTDMGNVSHVVPSIHPFYSITDSAIIHTREFQAAAGNKCCRLKLSSSLHLLSISVCVIFNISNLNFKLFYQKK